MKHPTAACTLGFMRTALAVVGMVLLAGCFVGVRDTNLGIDGGGVGGGGGGLAAGGGGGGGGGMAARACDTCKGDLDCLAGDRCGPGGVACITCPCFDTCQPQIDGGVGSNAEVPAPAPLTQAQCQWTLPAQSCANDAGTCLLLYPYGLKTKPPLEALTGSQLGLDTFHYNTLWGSDWLFFTTYRSNTLPPAPSRLLALPALGGALAPVLTLQQPTDRFDTIYAPAVTTGRMWFIAEIDTAAGRSVSLYLSNGTPWSAATVAALNVPLPTSNGVAVGSDYFVAHADGVYSYYPAGGGRIAQLPGVVKIAVTADEVLSVSCSAIAGVGCSLHRTDRKTFVTQQLLGGVQDRVGSIAMLGAQVYVLGTLGLIRVPLAGGASEVVFKGSPFPQHTGTLDPLSLSAHNGKLTFGSICHPDADAPGYGTIELDPAARTARWLNLEPEFPLVEGVKPFRGARTDPLITSRGLYSWIVR